MTPFLWTAVFFFYCCMYDLYITHTHAMMIKMAHTLVAVFTMHGLFMNLNIADPALLHFIGVKQWLLCNISHWRRIIVLVNPIGKGRFLGLWCPFGALIILVAVCFIFIFIIFIFFFLSRMNIQCSGQVRVHGINSQTTQSIITNQPNHGDKDARQGNTGRQW